MTIEYLAYVDGPGTDGYYVLEHPQPWCRTLAPGNRILCGPCPTLRDAEKDLADLEKAEVTP